MSNLLMLTDEHALSLLLGIIYVLWATRCRLQAISSRCGSTSLHSIC